MERAYRCAQNAALDGEVPVGAVLVKNDTCMAEAGNACIGLNDASAHAEILVLRKAGQAMGNYRLVDTTLFVTLEPCMMCVGAIIHARVERLVFAATDPKTGAVCSVHHLLDAEFVNHKVQWCGGVMEQACRQMLQSFFKSRR